MNAKFNSNHPSTELNLNEKYLRRKKKNAFKLSKIPFLRILIFACFHIAVRELEKIYRFIDLHLFMPRQNRYLFASWIRLKSKFNPRLGKIRSRSRVQASRSPIIRNRYPAWPMWPKLKRGIERILLGSIHPPITIIAFFTVVAEEKKRRKNRRRSISPRSDHTKAGLSTVNVEKVTRVRSRIDVYAVKRRKIESFLRGCNLTIQFRIFFASFESFESLFLQNNYETPNNGK